MDLLCSWFQDKKKESEMDSLSSRINKAKQKIEESEVLVIGAGAGLSTAAGLDFGGERFQKYMMEFGRKYGYSDMYSGDFYPYETLEEFWAFEAKTILVNRYEIKVLPLYRKLYDLIKNRNYFVLTTNVDGQFEKAGFSKKKIFATQGDYRFFQCKNGCHAKLYDNEAQIREMVKQTVDCKIPTNLVPKCPICGKPMEVNLRADKYFIEDAAWYKACGRYEAFMNGIDLKKVVYLEFGVGYNTPGIIRYPFEQQVYRNPNASLIRFNKDYPDGARENEDKTISFTEDIMEIVSSM